MPTLKVYADATALIALSRIDRLDLLRLLSARTYVTERVWEEISSDATKSGVALLVRARDEGLLAIVEEGDAEAFAQLDSGEATVLSAAAAARAVVVVDERKARALIASDPALKRAIPAAIGVVGLILLAKRRGQFPAIKPLLDDLVRQKFWISQKLYEDALHQAGEM